MISAKKGSVLCVDDEPGILRSLQWLLQKDFHIQTATGGEAGLQLLKDNDFDVILSDQRMPGMTGAQFLAHVKDISPRSMRLLLTGYSDMPALLGAVNEGEIWQFVTKPWEPEELKSLLHTAVEIAQESAAAIRTPVVEAPTAADILAISNDEEIVLALADCLEDNMCILRAANLAEAMHVLEREHIGVIVSEARLDTTDITSLLALVKQKRPDIVSIVIADHTNAEQLVQLINCGQLYRFVMKPPKKDYLQFLVKSAMTKHRQLAADPLLQARHRVVPADKALEHDLNQELGHTGPDLSLKTSEQKAPETRPQETGFFTKLNQRVSRLFGQKTTSENDVIVIE